MNSMTALVSHVFYLLFQVGVTASETGNACAAADESAILTRVSTYLPWITQEVCRLSSSKSSKNVTLASCVACLAAFNSFN